MQRLLALAFLMALALPASAAPPSEVLTEAAKLDHKPFELDTNATVATLRAFAGTLSGLRIHDCVAAITTGAANYRVMGTPAHDLFLQRYGNVFGNLGLATALQPFTKGGPGVGTTVPTGGTNILGALPGRDTSRWVVVGAHYDTRELTFGGGALDNTSGICTVLEMARQAKAWADAGGTFEASLLFAWYDGEEWGLYGATALAEEPAVARALFQLPENGPNATVLVSESFDMPGLNYPAKNTWLQYGNTTDLDEVAVLNLRTAPIHKDQEWACWSYGCYEDLKDRPDFAAVLEVLVAA
ncbi:MAG: M28 family peptidase, partial [Halobacteriales archaeon]|nr:M28 family peptidase [Halobacteriales archaeon]